MHKHTGYIVVGVRSHDYAAHRLAWLYVHGVWPVHEIDHINGVKSDNRICNLRDVPKAINSQNKRTTSKNISGLRGVSPSYKGWQARIVVDGASKYLGKFPTKEAAHAAYIDEKRRMHEGCAI